MVLVTKIELVYRDPVRRWSFHSSWPARSAGPSEQDFISQGGMEREGEGGKKGLHDEVEVEEEGEKGENGKTARGKKEREVCIV